MAMATRAVTVVAPGPPGLKRALNGRVVVVFPRFSDLAARIMIEPELTDEKGYLARAFAPVGIEPEALIVGIEPTPAEIEEAAERAAGADATVLFLYDARLFPSNRALLDALQSRARGSRSSSCATPTTPRCSVLACSASPRTASAAASSTR